MLIPTRPEAIGSLSLAARHRMAAEWHNECRRPWRRQQLVAKHASKARKLERRAAILEGVRSA